MELLEMIKDAGIIGAGGAGFPTHVKLAAKADYILLNGAECEPLLRVDQQLMEFYPDDVIRGFEMAGHLVEADQAIIGIKGKHKDVIAILEKRIKALGISDYVKIGILPDMYPAGDEQVLVYEGKSYTLDDSHTEQYFDAWSGQDICYAVYYLDGSRQRRHGAQERQSA